MFGALKIKLYQIYEAYLNRLCQGDYLLNIKYLKEKINLVILLFDYKNSVKRKINPQPKSQILKVLVFYLERKLIQSNKKIIILKVEEETLAQ